MVGETLCLYGTQVGVHEHTIEESLADCLEGHDGRALEPQVSLDNLGDFMVMTLEGKVRGRNSEDLNIVLFTLDIFTFHFNIALFSTVSQSLQ